MPSENTFIVIHDWMIEELKLTGNRLLVFAIVYGFTKDSGWFQGSMTYLAKRTGSNRRTMLRTLDSLVKDGLMERRERSRYIDLRTVTKCHRCQNVTCDKMSQVMGQNVTGNCDKMSHHNKRDNKEKINNARARKSKYSDFQQRSTDNLDYIEAVLAGKISPSEATAEEKI